MDGEVNQRTSRLIDLVPEGWFSGTEESSIWVRGYRVFRISSEVSSSPITIRCSNIIGVIFEGQISYVDASTSSIEFISETEWIVGSSQAQLQQTPKGTYLLLLTPFDIDGVKGDEPLVRERIDEFAGLLMALNGRNIAYQKTFDNVISMSGEQTTAFGPVAENPFWFDKPDISESNVDEIDQIQNKILLLPEHKQNRVKLSLRWFESAMRESGVDAFLSFWIALETLCMESSNIKPLIEALADTYSISTGDAKSEFGIGRIFGLRNKIVHHGERVAIHQNIQKYMEALYLDIFLRELDLPSKQRTKRVLDEPQFNLEDYF